MLSSAKNAAMDRQRCSPSLITFGNSTPGARVRTSLWYSTPSAPPGFLQFDFHMPELKP